MVGRQLARIYAAGLPSASLAFCIELSEKSTGMATGLAQVLSAWMEPGPELIDSHQEQQRGPPDGKNGDFAHDLPEVAPMSCGPKVPQESTPTCSVGMSTKFRQTQHVYSMGTSRPGLLGSSPRQALPFLKTWNKAANEVDMNDFSVEVRGQWDT